LSNNETKTVQLKIVSPVAKKFIDTLVQKVTEEGWSYNYDKVFTNPYKVFLTKEVYIDSEEPDITVVTGDFRKASAVEQVKYAYNQVQRDFDLESDTPSDLDIDPVLIEGRSGEVTLTYNPENVSVMIGGEVITGFSPEDTPESILSIPDEPVNDSTEEEVLTYPPELIEPVDAEAVKVLDGVIDKLVDLDWLEDIEVVTEVLQEKVGDGNVYTLELLKDIQWHKLTKIGSAYGLHAMKRGDMEAAIVNLSQGNKVDE